jgi:hypothetical protein
MPLDGLYFVAHRPTSIIHNGSAQANVRAALAERFRTRFWLRAISK